MSILSQISVILVPLVLCIASVPILFSKQPMFDDFIAGAKSGLESGVRLLPALVGLLTAIAMFSASGAMELIASVLRGPMTFLGIPPELVSLLVIRPVSGSGSTALATQIFVDHGVDSFIGMLASVIMASSDTVVYICAVYFSAAGVKRTRHALPAAFLTMMFSMFFAGIVVRLLY